jgi:hypothetical protein
VRIGRLRKNFLACAFNEKYRKDKDHDESDARGKDYGKKRGIALVFLAW